MVFVNERTQRIFSSMRELIPDFTFNAILLGQVPVFQQPPQKNGKDDREEESRSPNPDEKSDRERFKGLCMNCDNRFECLLPRPEGGVWHCEEYR